MNSIDHIETNLKTVLDLVALANSQIEKPKLIVFPENSLFFRVNSAIGLAAVEIQSGTCEKLQEAAKVTGINLHLTTALKDADGKIYNGSMLIEETGVVKIVYRKVHLFDIALTGQRPIRESDVFTGGSLPSTFMIGEIKFGSSVCYDIRFSELYANYAKAEVDVILVPSAFLVKTGQAHWEVLLRARAIESQCYVLAPAQAGIHKSRSTDDQRETYGNTIAIDPWGKILQVIEENVGLIYIDISTDLIKNVRQQIPMKSHRKL